MFRLRLIADLVRFDGYDVARLAATGVPPTVMADFEEVLLNIPDELPDADEEASQADADEYEFEQEIAQLLTDIMVRARKQAPVGLLSLGELGSIIKQIEDEREAAANDEDEDEKAVA